MRRRYWPEHPPDGRHPDHPAQTAHPSRIKRRPEHVAAFLFALLLAAPAPAATSVFRLPGAELIVPSTAERERSGQTIVLTGWGGDDIALRRPVSITAENYRFATASLEGLRPAQRAYLGWVTAEGASDAFHFTFLPWTGRPSVTVALPDSWHGKVRQLVLGIQGQHRDAVHVKELTLLPDGTGVRLSALRDRAIAYAPWDLKSVNNLPGTVKGDWLSPVSAATLLSVALVLFGLLVLRRAGASARRRTLFIALTLGCLWLVLDGLWQRRLLLQLAATRDTFQGLQGEERALADLDAPLYRMAQSLRPHLPDDPQHRVFLLHDSEGHNFQRLRLQYHLLPSNSYNFGHQLPAPGTYRAGDHVILLGELPGLVYDKSEGLLHDGTHVLPALHVTTAGNAKLYRLSRQDAEASR